ncbi:hypothetical protein BGZ91_007244, partial [Linnemannia elongata]
NFTAPRTRCNNTQHQVGIFPGLPINKAPIITLKGPSAGFWNGLPTLPDLLTNSQRSLLSGTLTSLYERRWRSFYTSYAPSKLLSPETFNSYAAKISFAPKDCNQHQRRKRALPSPRTQSTLIFKPQRNMPRLSHPRTTTTKEGHKEAEATEVVVAVAAAGAFSVNINNSLSTSNSHSTISNSNSPMLRRINNQRIIINNRPSPSNPKDSAISADLDSNPHRVFAGVAADGAEAAARPSS